MTITDLLKSHENKVLHIKRRLFFLKAFELKLQELTKEKPFQIRNDIVYQLVYDTWDMLVIDMASLCKDMLGRGGFFNKLKAATNQLKPAKPSHYTKPSIHINYMDSDLTPQEEARHQLDLEHGLLAQMVKYNHEAFFRLFPDARNRIENKIIANDVDQLKERFESFARYVIDDRNKRRAHKYERKEFDNNIKMLNINELEKKFKAIEEILNDIRLVCDRSSFSYSNMFLSNVKETSEDLATLILVGGLKMIDVFTGINDGLASKDDDKKFGWQYRKEFFESIHIMHDDTQSKYRTSVAKKINETRSYSSAKLKDPLFNEANALKIFVDNRKSLFK